MDVTVRTIQRGLSELGFGYKKVPKKLPLTKYHKDKRVVLSQEYIAENIINQNLAYTDEKRFSFDGPDNWLSWYDPYDPPRINRQQKGVVL